MTEPNEQVPTQVGPRGLGCAAVGLRGGAGGEGVGGGGGQAVAGGQRAVERGQAAAGVQQVGLLGDLAEQGAPLLTAGRQPGGDAASETRWSERPCC